MPKKDRNGGAKEGKQSPNDDKKGSIKDGATKSKGTRCSRRVVFSERLVERRLYDRTASPNAETTPVVTSLDDLGPPLSLVAHFDLAAKKLGARKSIEKIASPAQPSSPQPSGSNATAQQQQSRASKQQSPK